MDLTGWPEAMRVIVRKERPHPGAQLRFDDADAIAVTPSAVNQKAGQLAAHSDQRLAALARAPARLTRAKTLSAHHRARARPRTPAQPGDHETPVTPP
jgi:hypothetical protein